MRERSKKAARTRREKENHEFAELAKLLPLPANVTSQLDKASVVKLTTAYLKLRELFPQGLGSPWGSVAPEDLLKDLASFLLQALEGFLFIVGTNSKIIYISEGVSFYLGLSQNEMMGNSINEYVHVSDHDALKLLLNHEETIRIDSQIYEELEIARSFSLRMKCVLTKRSAGLVTDNYKLIYCRGYLKLRPVRLAAEGVTNPNDVRYSVAGLVAVGNAMHPTSILELKMYSHSFMYRAELDLKFLHLDPKAKDLTGYENNHLLYKSLYKFVHVRDCFRIREDHKTLIAKGQAVTSYYRFLTCGGGWIWMQTSFIVLLNAKSRQTFILAINHVISECEYMQYVVELEQISNVEFNFDSRDCFVSEQQPECVPETSTKDKTKKRKKKTELSSNNPGVMNTSFCPFDTNNRVLQNSNAILPYAGDFQSAANIQPRKEGNNFLHNIQDQPLNTTELSVNYVQSFTQSIGAAEASTSQFQHITRGQPVNTPEVSKNIYLPVTFNQSVNTEGMLEKIYFQSNIQNQLVNTAEVLTGLYQSAKYRQPVDRVETSTNNFQSFTCSSLPTAAEASASLFQPNTHGQSVNTTMSLAYNLQSVAVNSSSSHASDSPVNAFKSSCFTSGPATNSFLSEDMHRLTELSTISTPDISNEVHNSFFAMHPPFIAPMRDVHMDCDYPDYPNLYTNQRAQHAMSSGHSEVSDAMATKSSRITMCKVMGSYKKRQNTDDFKSICRSSFNHATRNGDLEHNSHLQTSTSDVTNSEINVTQNESLGNITPQMNKVTKNFKIGEMVDFNNVGDLKDELYIPINTSSDIIKNEVSIKDRLMDLCSDWSPRKTMTFNAMETDIMQTESLNPSYLELTEHWVASNNFDGGYSNVEPLDIRSECTSNMSLASNEQSPFSENREFSFSSEEIIPHLNNLSNYTSGYSDQSSNENSKSYIDVQSSSSNTNRTDSLGLSFFQSSSSTPLYTVL